MVAGTAVRPVGIVKYPLAEVAVRPVAIGKDPFAEVVNRARARPDRSERDNRQNDPRRPLRLEFSL